MPRPTRPPKPPCNNCPTPADALAAVEAAKTTLVTLPGESERLWKHVLFGTGTCVGMAEGYAKLNMPGNPVPQLKRLRDRLTNLIARLESSNEGHPSNQ